MKRIRLTRDAPGIRAADRDRGRRNSTLIGEPWPRIPYMWCKPSRSETLASCLFNRRSARPPAPHVHWQHGLRRITSASLPGHEPEIPISATGARRKFWSGLASSLMNMRRVAG
jgi:hypothetical protein